MLLSDSGEILWSENLPKELNHPYTVPEVAAFSRWYLQDYPVMVYRNDYGLLVAGKPKGSMTRFDFYMDNDILYALLSTFVPMVLIVVVFWLFLIRPQRKKDKKIKEMLAALKVGDRVCTIGGIYGTITNIRDESTVTAVGPQDVPVVFARWAIRNVEEITVENDTEVLA